MKGEKPSAPTRGVSKWSAAVGADDVEDVDDVEEDAVDAAAELLPRTDIRSALDSVYV